MKIEYRKGDVWIVRWGGDLIELTIKDVCGNFVRHYYGWESVEEWHKRAMIKIGVRRKFCGINLGIKRDRD